MKTFKKVLLRSIAVILLFLCVTATWFYLVFILPVKTVSNLDLRYSAFDGDYNARKKIRDASHKILSRRAGNHHAAFIAISEAGNKDSIPYLIRALKMHSLEWQRQLATSKLVVCTCGNCVGALRQLTGMDFGMDYEAWQDWWEETGRHLPFDEEKGQLILPEGRE